MTTDNSRYEEAAKAHYPYVRLNSWEGARAGFIAGASFAEKDGWNAAIDKALEIVQRGSYSSSFHLAKELEKLKYTVE